MSSYQPLPESGGYSSPIQPYRRTGDTAIELQLLDSSEGRPRADSRFSQNLQSSPSYESYGSHRPADIEGKGLLQEPVYRQYKRRYFGLSELALLNFATGWGFAAPGVVATTAIAWYDISYAELNNLSIASSLVFLVPAPFVICKSSGQYTLHRDTTRFLSKT